MTTFYEMLEAQAKACRDQCDVFLKHGASDDGYDDLDSATLLMNEMTNIQTEGPDVDAEKLVLLATLKPWDYAIGGGAVADLILTWAKENDYWEAY